MAATAVRVFGKPITQGTRTQRAQAAKNYQNVDAKYDQVTQATIHSQKAAAGGANTATVSTTIGRVYNATGDPLTYVIAHDWQGSVVGQYPMKIQNGQWAIFEHVGTSGANRQGSVAAVVFNIQDCSDSLIAWNDPWKTATSGNNTVRLANNIYTLDMKSFYEYETHFTVMVTYFLDYTRACKYDTEAVMGGGEIIKAWDFYNYISVCLFSNETTHLSQL